MNYRGEIIQLPSPILEFHLGADKGVISVTISTVILSLDQMQALFRCSRHVMRSNWCQCFCLSEKVNVSVIGWLSLSV